MPPRIAPFLCLLSVLPFAARAAEIRHDPARQTWTLASGPVEYRLRAADGTLRAIYLGPAGGRNWGAPRDESGGLVDDQRLRPEELTLVAQALQGGTERRELRLAYRHKRIPLAVDVVYTAWGDTGVFTREVTLHNTGDHGLPMAAVPSLDWDLPAGDYTLDYLHGHWGEERQLSTEPLALAGRRSFVNTTGRSTDGASPWLSLRNATLGVRYAAELAYSGNWEMSFERLKPRHGSPDVGGDLHAQLGMRFDFGGTAPLAPGAAFVLPAVAFTASAGDLDDVANQLHRYQYRYAIARTPANDPLLVTLNPWQAVYRQPTAQAVMRYADEAAALGVEAVIIDAGWFSSRVNPIYGDWQTDRKAFPHGLKEVADHLHARGMKFGVWLEPECVGSDSETYRQHPDWVLRYHGVPHQGTRNRVYLNFALPAVRQWIRGVVDRLVREDGVDWLKFDYNVDVGEAFDPTGPARSGTVLHEHLRNYYAFLDGLRRDYPNLVLENCSSGGLRFDLGIIGHTHTTWLSDVVEPHKSVQLAYGATMEFTPGVCNHWMVGDTEAGGVNPAGPPEWWDFMFRIAMNGQFGLSSRLMEWTPALKQRATANIALYKRLRPIISGADVYHLTPPPAAGRNPTGWMALQYNAADGHRSALLAFRLGRSEAQRTFQLRGLDPGARYRLTSDGRDGGVLTGRQLAGDGVPVSVNAEWRSAVIELETVP